MFSKEDIEKEILVNGNTNYITDSGIASGAQVFAIGDSHTIFFHNSMRVKEHWLTGMSSGMQLPLTIYTLLKDGINIYEIGNLLKGGHEKYNIKKKDFVIFYFGFNDMQRNIHMHAKNNSDNEIQIMVISYVEYINTLVKQYEIIPIVSCIYPNPLPYAQGQNPSGSFEERKIYTQKANKLLDEQCKKHSILYLDIYDIITDADGFIKKEYTSDYIHLDYNNDKIRNIVETEIFRLIYDNYQSKK